MLSGLRSITLCCVCILTLLQGGCSAGQARTGSGEAIQLKHFDLSIPQARYPLPEAVHEVSGLTYVGPNLIGMIQDEKGKIYVYDTEKKDLDELGKFGDKGDYEGLEMVGETMYVIQSNGDVFEVEDFMEEEDKKAKKYENDLRKKNNTEALAYDPQNHLLLIGCKSSPNLKDSDEDYLGFRAIYAFDLQTKELRKEPYMLIAMDSLKRHLHEGPFNRFSRKVVSELGEDITLRPSGLAIDPITGHFYLLSSIGKLLVVLNSQGQILEVERLRPGIFNHPEGICFSPEGDLYISNEGDEGIATLLKFKRK